MRELTRAGCSDQTGRYPAGPAVVTTALARKIHPEEAVNTQSLRGSPFDRNSQTGSGKSQLQKKALRNAPPHYSLPTHLHVFTQVKTNETGRCEKEKESQGQVGGGGTDGGAGLSLGRGSKGAAGMNTAQGHRVPGAVRRGSSPPSQQSTFSSLSKWSSTLGLRTGNERHAPRAAYSMVYSSVKRELGFFITSGKPDRNHSHCSLGLRREVSPPLYGVFL